MPKSKPRTNSELPPELYPWISEPESQFLSSEAIFALNVDPDRRVGQALVEYRGGVRERLNKVMVLENASFVDARTLVVAVGSNGAPGVIAEKYRRTGSNVTFATPFVACTLAGISVGHSAHVSVGGYIPAAPFASEGSEVRLVAAWFDDRQLRQLDSTEPNYTRVMLSAGEFPLTLESGEQPAHYYIYVSRHGVLAEPESAAPLEFASQGELFTRLEPLVDAGLFGGEPSTVCARLAERPNETKGLFDARHMVRRSGLPEEPAAPPPELASGISTVKYGATRDLAATPRDVHELIAVPTSNSVQRIGENVIALHPDTIDQFGLDDHASVRAGSRLRTLADRPSVVVGVRVDDTVARDEVQIDQVVRNALGVERQEVVEVRPAKPSKNRWLNVLVGRPKFVTCRVEPADLPSVEQNVCLVDPLVLAILGIPDGSLTIIEGSIGADSPRVPELRIRATTVGDDVSSRRRELNGGGFESRYPSASDALGVFPDLPRVFLDATARSMLGLGSHKLAAVRIQASRWDQVTRTANDLLLVLALAFIGVATSLTNGVVIAVFGGVALLALWITRVRLRRQLGSPRIRRVQKWVSATFRPAAKRG